MLRACDSTSSRARGSSRSRKLNCLVTRPQIPIIPSSILHSFPFITTYLSYQYRIATMTTFVPFLTLPAAVFASPAVSILLPVVAGTAVGFSVQRTYILIHSLFALYTTFHPCLSHIQAQLIPSQPEKPKRPTWHSGNPPTAHHPKSSDPPGPSSTASWASLPTVHIPPEWRQPHLSNRMS
jgi:hypothetical protein